jgi:DNA repair protein RadC
MIIKNWPQKERPREKLLHQGAKSLSNAELLAIFLRTGTRGQDALTLARYLIGQFGSLRQLLNASFEEFKPHKGIGLSKYVQLKAILEVAQRYLEEDLSRTETMNNSRTVEQYLTGKLRHRPQEIFAVLFLDNQNQLIAYEEMSQGSINHANVYPREIVRRALQHNSNALILAHNHPSGINTASEADKRLTQALQKALSFIEVTVLDHFIIGEGAVLSFSRQGLL